MNQYEKREESSINRIKSEESVRRSISNPGNSPTTTNQIYKSELIINPKATKIINEDVQLQTNLCFNCQKLIDNENLIKFNQNKYHRDCFRCFKCNQMINQSKFHLENNQPLCNQCYVEDLAPLCSKCLKSILEEKSIIYNENHYHPDCFRCFKCNQIINESTFPTHQNKPFCRKCYEQYLAPKCSKCSKPISTGKSILFNENRYHPDCLRCFKCDQLINESKVHQENNQVYCFRCYDQCFAPKCFQCLKSINDGKSIIYDQNKYHPECFRCSKCNQIINQTKFHTQNNKPFCNDCFDQYVVAQCSKCFRAINDDKGIIFNGNNYHPDCFRCLKCNQIIKQSKFYIENDKPCCNQCYEQYVAPQCSKCFKPINDDKGIGFNGKNYHSYCFRCYKCNQTMNQSKFYTENNKVYCNQCYDQYVVPQCFKCHQSISSGKSILFDGNNYHPDCFRCIECNQIINESKFHTKSNKPYCLKCAKDSPMLSCTKCSKPISDRYSAFQGKNYHIECFLCDKCHRIIQSKDKFYAGDLGVLCSSCST